MRSMDSDHFTISRRRGDPFRIDPVAPAINFGYD